MKNFWVSWYGSKIPFTLDSPWWVSGYRMSDDSPTICAAVRASSERAAKAVVIAAHSTPPDDLEWRFVNGRDTDWTPFNDRFPKASWMRW